MLGGKGKGGRVGQRESPSGTEVSPCLRVANLQKILFIFLDGACSADQHISGRHLVPGTWQTGAGRRTRTHKGARGGCCLLRSIVHRIVAAAKVRFEEGSRIEAASQPTTHELAS
jgi:hypothetical protein